MRSPSEARTTLCFMHTLPGLLAKRHLCGHGRPQPFSQAVAKISAQASTWILTFQLAATPEAVILDAVAGDKLICGFSAGAGANSLGRDGN